MRRAEKEIKDPQTIDDIIARAEIVRIALCDGDMPYIVPVNFGYDGKCLYFHCALKGRKLDIIGKNNNICFEIDIDHKMTISDTACEWGFKYKSVIGFGKAYIIDDLEDKKRGLDIILRHYSDKVFTYRDEKVATTLLVKIEIDSITGKQSA